MANSGKASGLEATLSTVPAGANPFIHITKEIIAQLSLINSRFSIGMFTMFLVFHSLIFVFCVFLLIMSCLSGPQRARWLVRTLYIQDQSGQKVYSSPLYFLNAGILMAFFQVMCSISAAGYIWIEIRSVQSIADYSVDSRVVPPLASMFFFETLSHWTLTHCFFVTVYFSRPFNPKMKQGMMRWISPPLIINSFFIGFPTCVALAVAGMTSWTTSKHHLFAIELTKILDALKQGSGVWKELHDGVYFSAETAKKINHRLVQITMTLKKIAVSIRPLIQHFAFAFHWCLITIFLIVCVNFLVFIPVFCMLAQKYYRGIRGAGSSCMLILPRGQHSNWAKQEAIQCQSRRSRLSENLSGMRALVANKQFFLLLLRTLCVILSMLSQMISALVLIIKSEEVIMDKDWRNVASWITISSGAWAAIPIVWQCWRLYDDQKNEQLGSSSRRNSHSTPLTDIEHGGFQPCQTHDVEVELYIK